MLRKLLKYDLAFVFRMWWIIAVSALGLSLLGGFGLRFFIANADNNKMIMFCIMGLLLFLLSVFAIVGSSIVTLIFVFIRFYKHFYTDEGYLTFTLPVKRRDLFLSKTVNAMIWMTAQLLLTLICIAIIILVAPPATENDLFLNTYIYKEIFSEVSLMVKMTGGGWFALYAFEVLVLILGMLLFSVTLIHFCITVGAVIARRAKLIAGIGIYYGVNSVLSFTLQMLFILGISMVANKLDALMSTMPSVASHTVVALMLFIACAVCAALNVILYFMTVDKIERKLNLS